MYVCVPMYSHVYIYVFVCVVCAHARSIPRSPRVFWKRQEEGVGGSYTRQEGCPRLGVPGCPD